MTSFIFNTKGGGAFDKKGNQAILEDIFSQRQRDIEIGLGYADGRFLVTEDLASIHIQVKDDTFTPQNGSFSIVATDSDGVAEESGHFPVYSDLDTLECILNEMEVIKNAGGVSVYQDCDEPLHPRAYSNKILLRWNCVGNPPTLAIGTNNVSPVTILSIDTVVVGMDDRRGSSRITATCSPIIDQTFTASVNPPSITVTTIQPAIVNQKQVDEVVISGDPYGGTYTLNVDNIDSSMICPNSNAYAIQSAFPDGNYCVSRSSPNSFRIQYTDTLPHSTKAGDNNLLQASTLQGNLDLTLLEPYMVEPCEYYGLRAYFVFTTSSGEIYRYNFNLT